MPLKPVRGEHLVPVIADPAAGPAIPAAARQTHRAGVGRCEERLRRGGTPVDQQPAARAVGQAKPPDVHGLGVTCADDVSQAQVQTETTQDAQPSGQPVDLDVPVHRLLAYAARRLALGIEAAGQIGDRLLKALRDGREVLLVAGDQRRVGLGGKAAGKVKRAGTQRVHVISSNLRSRAATRVCRFSCAGRQPHTHLATPNFRRFWPRPAIMRHDPGLAASPPVRYTLKVEGCRYSPSPHCPPWTDNLLAKRRRYLAASLPSPAVAARWAARA